MVLLTIGPFKIQTTPPPKKHQKNTKKRQKQDAKWTLLPEVEQFPTKYCSCPRKPQIGRGFCRCHHIMRGRQANQSSQSHPVGLFRLLSWPLQGKAQPLYPLPSNFLTESRTENTSDFLVNNKDLVISWLKHTCDLFRLGHSINLAEVWSHTPI